MHRIHAILMMLVCGSMLSAGVLTAQNKPAERSLFNGKDLTGWKVPDDNNGHWKVIDGVIDYDALLGKHLWTEASFGDFKLHIEWRFKETNGLYNMMTILPDGSYKKDANGKVIQTPTPNADSGILLRGTDHQINLWCWPVGSGELWSVRLDETLAPALRAAAVPKVRADKPVGEWNAMDVTLIGNRLTVVLNDKTVIEKAQIPGLPATGPLGLQHHGGIDKKTGKYGSACALVQFRNIRIQELK